MKETSNIIQEILNLIRSDLSKSKLRKALDHYHESDIADAVAFLSKEERQKLYEILGDKATSDIFAHLDDVEDYIEELDDDKAADILQEMDADDAIDVLQELDLDDRKQIVSKMEDEAKQDIKLIASYEEDEIGSKMTTNYIAMYSRQIGLQVPTGFFFTCMAVGMAISRIFSGRLVDRGKITQVIATGIYIVILSFFLLSFCANLIVWNSTVCSILFFTIALCLGIGFGIMFPAFNSLFVNLAPNSQRGTATSTYLTSWDIGIGIGMLTGGYIAEISTFDKAYLFGACLTIISSIYFHFKVVPHYHKNKLK